MNEMMDKEFALKLLKILSAIEAIGAINKDIPDYILNQLVYVIDCLSKVVLSDEPN